MVNETSVMRRTCRIFLRNPQKSIVRIALEYARNGPLDRAQSMITEAVKNPVSANPLDFFVRNKARKKGMSVAPKVPAVIGDLKGP